MSIRDVLSVFLGPRGVNLNAKCAVVSTGNMSFNAAAAIYGCAKIAGGIESNATMK